MQIKKLGEIAEYINGRAFKPEEWEKHGKPIIRIQNLTNSSNECNRTTKQFEEKYAIKSGDLLFAWSASLGAHIWNAEEGWLNQHIFKVIPRVGIDKMYLYYFLLQVVDELYSKTHGTGMVHITLKPFKNTEIPVPSYEEQRKIVVIIESLFTKLDEAKEKVQIVINASENRKAAILHAAFSGKLTERWRESHLVAESTWRELGFSEVADIKSNLVLPEDYLEYPHIAPDNIEKKTGRLLDYRTIAEDRVTSSKHKFYPGQILYSKIRPYLSKVVMVDFDGLCSADMYPIEAKENMEYLWFYMLSDMFLEQVTTAGSRSVLPKINQKELSMIRVKIPSENEQEKVVKILKKVFERENIIKDLVETVLESIELTKKSILSKAFHGELGTNDISEPCSIELLKEIIN